MTGMVIVILDSLRADAVDLAPDGDTPNMAALAQRGTAFRRAVAPAAWTLPSHVSMMTGLHPTEHRIQARSNAREAMGHARTAIGELAAEGVFLPGWLRSRGVATFLGSANVWVSALSGFGRWFDEVEYAPFPPRGRSRPPTGAGPTDEGAPAPAPAPGGPRQEEPPRLPEGLRKVVPLPLKHVGKHAAENLMRYRNAARQAKPIATWAVGRADKSGGRVVDGFDRWITGRDGSFFALFNLIETHGPHLAPRGWGRTDVGAILSTVRHPGQTWARRMNLHNWGYRKLGSRSLERLTRAYRAEVRYADHLVGRIVSALERSGLLDTTTVIVAGDHGEAFGEAGLVGHGLSLGEAVAHVPLIAAGPDVPVASVEEPVGLRSFAATAGEVFGGAGHPFAGASLFSSDGRGEAQMEVESPWLHFHPGAGLRVRDAPPGMERPAAAFYAGHLKLIVGSFWQEALYDLDRDPAEEHNLIDEMPCPTRLAEMRAAWEQRLARV